MPTSGCFPPVAPGLLSANGIRLQREMSKSRFFKHLSYTFSWGLHRPLSLSTFKACQYQSKPNSSLFSKMISSSSSIRSCTSLAASHDTSATTDSSAYLSVRIRCPKDVAVRIISSFLRILRSFGTSFCGVFEPNLIIQSYNS